MGSSSSIGFYLRVLINASPPTPPVSLAVSLSAGGRTAAPPSLLTAAGPEESMYVYMGCVWVLVRIVNTDEQVCVIRLRYVVDDFFGDRTGGEIHADRF